MTWPLPPSDRAPTPLRPSRDPGTLWIGSDVHTIFRYYWRILSAAPHDICRAPFMPPPLVVSLLVLVSLPMVPWASRLTNDLVPETGYPASRVVVLFQAVADHWSGSSYDDVT